MPDTHQKSTEGEGGGGRGYHVEAEQENTENNYELVQVWHPNVSQAQPPQAISTKMPYIWYRTDLHEQCNM